MAAFGSQQTLQLTLSPWVGIPWDLNLIQDINSCCTLFVVTRHLAFTAAFSHFVLCDNRLSSLRPQRHVGYLDGARAHRSNEIEISHGRVSWQSRRTYFEVGP